MNPNIPEALPVPGNDEIREILAKRIDQQKQATGIVFGIADRNGRRVVAHGNLAKGDPLPVDGDTIFEIGSVSKVFTSLLLADMVSRKEVALDDPAAKYLPDIRMPERNGKPIGLLDLATHSSGLPNIPNNMPRKDPANPYADYTVDDLYQFLSGYTLPRDPGSEVEYSTVGAGLLGHVLSCRAGMDYESLVKTRITKPLGMADTAIGLSSSQRRRMAAGYNAKLEAVPNWDLPTLAGAGALRSSASDMLTFVEAFLGSRESVLGPSMKSMLDVRRPTSKGPFEIGFGWFFFGDVVWHDGGTGGFQAFIGYNPKTRTAAVALSNAAPPGGVADIAMNLLIPKTPLSNFDPPQQHSRIVVDPDVLDRYTGRYELPDRILEITRDGGRLFAQVTSVGGTRIAGPVFDLSAEDERNFSVQLTGGRISFEPGSDGRATGLVMHRTGRLPLSGSRLP